LETNNLFSGAGRRSGTPQVAARAKAMRSVFTA